MLCTYNSECCFSFRVVQIYYLGEKPGRTGTTEQEQACGYMWGRETEIMLYKALEDFQIFLFIISTFM